MNLKEEIGEKLKELSIGFPFLCHGIGNGISSCTSSLSFYNCDCLNVY
jgi:hypothetical protein